ncbi:polyprenyl synthetase family protein [Rhizobium sp. TH2]|uniref:polyprenyl synthetase family protein n=1 Tax=Rhizobium sp. TH2 TaxID=2775403 RepID=UPI002157477E|nr:farnesyl diphosphate synthase [Rhizobium sp. TH2]UVC08413.1 polyprenyl synthetase family protein [Rhizobium sp. TH2]
MREEVFLERLGQHGAAVQALLGELLSGDARHSETIRPERLLGAMRHGVLNGGKRMRPALVIESAALFGGDAAAALRVAAALECVHCYSLIHDDLPAMDDDDLRRGQPTVHRKFDEATAILAGDSLLTYAFDIVAAPETALPDATKIALVLALSRASGIGGMAGGQALDLEAETRELAEDEITRLQAMKTGALIRFACEAGALAAGASDADRRRMLRFGEIVGLAFQLQDDLLDLTADSATLGKAAGKDAARGKKTLPSIHGVQWTQHRLAGLIEEATALLSPYGERANMLIALASYVATRKN